MIYGRSDHAAHFGDVAFHATDSNEFCVRHLRNDSRQRSLAASRRAGENHRRQTISLNGAPQEFSRPKYVFLADEFVQGARAHPRSKRGGAVRVFDIFPLLEQIVHQQKYGRAADSASHFLSYRDFVWLERVRLSKLDSKDEAYSCAD